jgi:signal recognition particle subunit SRP19
VRRSKKVVEIIIDGSSWSLLLSHLEKKKSKTFSIACDDPLMPEIWDCISQPWGLQLPAEAQQASHPADYKIRCRVRVALKGADGLPFNPEVPDRKALFLKVAELLPRHPNRSPEAVARRKAEEAAAWATAATAAAMAQGGGGGGGASGGSGASSSSQQGTQQRSSSKKKGRK